MSDVYENKRMQSAKVRRLLRIISLKMNQIFLSTKSPIKERLAIIRLRARDRRALERGRREALKVAARMRIEGWDVPSDATIVHMVDLDRRNDGSLSAVGYMFSMEFVSRHYDDGIDCLHCSAYGVLDGGNNCGHGDADAQYQVPLTMSEVKELRDRGAPWYDFGRVLDPSTLLTQKEVDALPHGTPIAVIDEYGYSGVAWPGTLSLGEDGSRWSDFGEDVSGTCKLDNVGPAPMTQVRLRAAN